MAASEQSKQAMNDLTVTMGVLRQGLEDNGFTHEEAVGIAKDWLIQSTIATQKGSAASAASGAASLQELLARTKTTGKPS